MKIMKTQIFSIAILCGLLSTTEAFAQNTGTVGGGSPAPGTTPGGAVNKPRGVEPGLNRPNGTHPTNPNPGFNHGVVTNRFESRAITNEGSAFTNALGSGSMTNRMGYGSSMTNKGNGFDLGNTNNGRVVNPNNPYATYTNPYSTYTNLNATDPRRLERGGTITNK